MKAIVTQISGNRAVLLRQDGTFARARNRGYRVGQRIDTGGARRPALKPMLAFACAVLVLFSATALAANLLPFSYVSIDVNPSLQMTLNWFDRVLGIQALNADAEGIAERLMTDGIARQPVGVAVQRVYAALERERYVAAGEQNDVVVAVASYGIKDVAPLYDALAQMQKVENSGTELNLRIVQADRAMIAEAEELGTTAGKLAVVKPIANGSAEETRAWLRRSVREIFAFGQGAADAEAITLTVEPEPTQFTAEPTPTATPMQNGPTGTITESPSPSPQVSPARNGQDSGQRTVTPAPVNTPKPSATPVPSAQPTAVPTVSAQPPAAPQNTGSNPAATGGVGQSQPATSQPGGGQGKGN